MRTERARVKAYEQKRTKGARVLDADGRKGTVYGVPLNRPDYVNVRWDEGTTQACPTSRLRLAEGPT